MSTCNDLLNCYVADCDNTSDSVVDPEVLIFKRDDIDTLTRDATNPLIITAFTLKAGANGVSYTAIKADVHDAGSTPEIDDAGLTEYTHTFNTTLMDTLGDGGSDFRLRLGSNNVVVAIRTARNGVKFFGLDNGLVLTGGTQNYSDAKGRIPVEMSSRDNLKEAYPESELRFTTPTVDDWTDLKALTACP
jgi:hypothetical protein